MSPVIPKAVLASPHGTHTAHPGVLIGRLDHPGTIVVPHPGVSEAHAMVSVREGWLVLLPLRGELWVNDEI